MPTKESLIEIKWDEVQNPSLSNNLNISANIFQLTLKIYFYMEKPHATILNVLETVLSVYAIFSITPAFSPPPPIVFSIAFPIGNSFPGIIFYSWTFLCRSLHYLFWLCFVCFTEFLPQSLVPNTCLIISASSWI